MLTSSSVTASSHRTVRMFCTFFLIEQLKQPNSPIQFEPSKMDFSINTLQHRLSSACMLLNLENQTLKLKSFLRLFFLSLSIQDRKKSLPAT